MRFPILLKAAAIAACLSVAQSAEQTELRATALTQPIQEILSKLNDVDGELDTQADDFRQIILKEEQAGRITPAQGKALRWKLRTSIGYIFSPEGIRAFKLPAGNTALSDGYNKLVDAVESYRLHRRQLLEGVPALMRQRARMALFEAKTTKEISALTEGFDTLKIAIYQRYGDLEVSEVKYFIETAESIISYTRGLVEAEQTKDPERVAVAMERFKSAVFWKIGIVSPQDLESRRDQTYEPFRAQLDKAEDTLSKALLEKRSDSEVADAFAAFEKLDAQFRCLGPDSYLNQSAKLAAYREIAAALRGKDGDSGVQIAKRTNNAREQLSKLGKGRAAEFLVLLAGSQSGGARSSSERNETIRKRIVAASGPADLESLAGEMDGEPNRPGRNFGADEEYTLRACIEELARAWKTRSVPERKMISRRFQGGDLMSEAPKAFRGSLELLREKIERDNFATLAGLPEIMAEPLSKKPFNVAIEEACDQLAKQREWRRLFAVLQASPEGESEKPSEELTGLRAFLTAQNFEAAEAWGEAATEYRKVLRATSDRLPIAEAAERLKQLGKTHPETKKAAQTSEEQ